MFTFMDVVKGHHALRRIASGPPSFLTFLKIFILTAHKTIDRHFQFYQDNVMKVGHD